jgi:hypothetical protein
MKEHSMSDTTATLDATAGEPAASAAGWDPCLDDDRRDDDLTPPHAGDLDITDLQQWIDLCA